MSDFLPVGIQAVAKGVDTFVAELGRMQTAVTTYNRAAARGAESQQRTARTANQAAQAMRALGQTNQSLSQQANAYVASQKLVAAQVQDTIQRLGAQGNAMQRTREQTTQTSNAMSVLGQKVTAAAAPMQTLSQRTASLRAQQAGLQAQIQVLAQKLVELKQAEAAVSAENKRMAAAQSRAKTAQASANQQVVQLTQRLRVLQNVEKLHTQTLKNAQNATRRNETQIKALGAVLDQNRQRQKAVSDEIRKYREVSNTATAALSKFSQAQSQSRLTALNLGQAIAVVKNEMKSLSAESNAIGGRLGRMEAALRASNAAGQALRGTAQALGGGLRGVAGAIGVVSRGLKGLHGGINTAIAGVKRLNDRIRFATEQMFRWGNSIRFLGTSMTFLVTGPILGFLGGLTKAAIDFEDAFIGIVRTVDEADFRLLPEGETDIRKLTELGEILRQKIIQLGHEIPVPTAELAKLGEVAGTLGVRGVGNLEKFVEVTAKLGLTTNITGEEAARGLGKILAVAGQLSDAELSMQGFTDAEIKAMSGSERFQKTLEVLGGTVVALGNKMPATEQEIVNFALEIAGAGDVMGVTSRELLGIAAAFTTVGVAASRGRTAFQKTMFNMLEAAEEGGHALEIFAAVSDKSMEEFQATLEGAPGQAFTNFIEGLGRSGTQAIKILDELGLANERTRAALLALASSEGALSQATTIANEELLAQIENMSALELEAARRASTTSSQLQILKNQFTTLGITVGSFALPIINKFIAGIRGLLEAINDLDPRILKLGTVILLLVASIGPVLVGLGTMMSLIGLTLTAMSSLIGVVLSLFSGLGLLVIPLGAVAAAFVGLTIALAAVITNMARTADEGFSQLARNMWEFGKNIILAFAKGMAQAAAAVITVLNSIGKAIAYWLRPGSPPRLLPDLDEWGTEAMNSYLEGWKKADFDIFNDIADTMERWIRAFQHSAEQAGKEKVVEMILGTRREIKRVVDQFRRTGKVAAGAINRVLSAAGTARKEVRNYIKALLDLELATAKVMRIQDQMAEVNKRYADSLKPLNRRLAEIQKRQDEVSRAMRIRELEQILADPRAPELVRELAQLEMEQIDLEGSVDELESQRDAELEILQTRLDAAEAEMEAAQERFDAAEALLDVIIKERELLNEVTDAAEKLKKGIEDALSGADIELGELEIPVPDDFDLGDAITDSVSDVISEINEEFLGLFADIKAIFAPLEDLWKELGETWAPIFDAIFGPIADFLGVKFKNPFEDYVMPSELAELREQDPLFETVLGAGLGGRELFTDQHISGIREFGDALTKKLIPAFGDVIELVDKVDKRTKPLRQFIAVVFQAFGDTLSNIDFSGITAAWEQFTTILEDTGAIENLKSLGAIIAGLWIGNLAVITGVIQGLVRAVEFMLPFFAFVLQGIGLIAEGITRFVTGIRMVLEGDFAGGIRFIFGGVLEFLAGIGSIIIGLLGAIIGGIVGLVAGFGQGFFDFLSRFTARLDTEWSEMWTGVFARAKHFWNQIVTGIQNMINDIVEWFVSLYDDIVGNSIVPDLINGILEWFGKLWDLPGEILSWVGEMIGHIESFATDAIAAIETWWEETKAAFGRLIEEAPQMLVDAGTAIVQGLIDGLDAGKSLVETAVSNLANLIPGPIKKILGITSPSKELIEVGEQAIEGLIKGLEKSRNEVTKIMEQISSAVVNTAGDTLQKLVTVSRKRFVEFVEIVVDHVTQWLEIWGLATTEFLESTVTMWQEWLKPMAPTLNVFLEAFKTAMEEWVVAGEGSAWGRALRLFLEMFDKTLGVDWIRQLKTYLNIFDTWFTEMVNTLKAQYNSFKAAGRHVMEGFRAGLESMRGAIMSTAASIANAAKAAVDGALENASPSKVFMEIGENVILGWIAGMEGMKSDLVSAMGDASGAMLAAAPQALPAQASQPQAVLPASVAASGSSTTYNNSIEMGGQTINQPMDVFTLQIMIEQALENVLK